MAFELYKNKKTKKYYFRLLAKNKKTILQSQGYADKRSAKTGIKAVIKEAAAGNLEKKKAKDGSHYFVVRSKNGQQVGKSQMYKSASGVAIGIKAVTNNAVNEIAEVEA